MSSLATNVEAWGTFIGAIIAVGGVGRAIITSSRNRTTELAKDRAEHGAAQFVAGAQSRDDEIRTLKSERDDARHDRDVARADAKEWRKRALDRHGEQT